MSTLRGADDLKRALAAAAKSWRPIGKKWADEAIKVGQPMVPVRSSSMRAGDGHAPGRLRASFERNTPRGRKAVVKAHYTAYFIDAGVKPHSMQSRKSRPTSGAGRTIFSSFARKDHPGYRARPFRQHMADEGLRRAPLDDAIIEAWNAELA